MTFPPTAPFSGISLRTTCGNLFGRRLCFPFCYLTLKSAYGLLPQICYRAFALDVSLALLDLPEREPDATLSEEQQNFLMHKFLVQVMIFGRCSDKASVIRSKALSSFALCLQTKSSSQLETMQELLQGSEYQGG